MGLLRVQLDVLHELFLRLRRERARAVHPAIGTPDRVSHRSSLPFVTAATLPPERANVNRLFWAALLAAECRVALPPEGDIGGPRVTAPRVGADSVHVAVRELTPPDGVAMFHLLPASADHPSRRGRSVRSRSVRECSRRTGPPARHVFLPSAYPTGPSFSHRLALWCELHPRSSP